MKIKTTRFKNLKVFQGKSHLDNRGAFRELFSKNSIKEFNGVFWCMSKSKKNVVRGLHILSQKNSKSLYIPKGFAHGFMGMDKENYVVYGNSNYRSKKNELGIMWNDKDLGINWPARRPLVSKKDRNNLAFKEFCKRHIKN